MATVSADARDGPGVETVSDLPGATRRRIFLYLGGLLILLGFGAPGGGLIGVPIAFFLKNKLHLGAQAIALFALIATTPFYVSFLFGFARDRLNPFGRRDRGFIILFGALGAAIALAFAFAPSTYGVLIVAFLLGGCAYLFVQAAQNGLSSAIAQQHAMSGQVSAAWGIFGNLPVVVALVLGGPLSEAVEHDSPAHGARLIFLTAAAIMAATALYGLWKPAAVFANVHGEAAPSARTFSEIRRLARHAPVWPALLIWTLWQFAPGIGTPLQFFLQNTLHSQDAQFGQWWAIYLTAFMPTTILYGLLCRRLSLRALLWLGTVVAVPMMIPLLFIHSIEGALIAAAPLGLMGGLASSAYLDLVIRSAPHGLQGTVMMAAAGLLAIDGRLGDLLATWLYDRFGGFTVCVATMTLTNLVILPAILLVPREVTAHADGATGA